MDKNPHFHKQISGIRASCHSRQIDLIDYISGIAKDQLGLYYADEEIFYNNMQ